MNVHPTVVSEDFKLKSKENFKLTLDFNIEIVKENPMQTVIVDLPFYLYTYINCTAYS